MSWPASVGLRWLKAARPGFLAVTLVATVLGLSVAWACGSPVEWRTAVAAVVLALLTHAAVNLHNDWGDAAVGSDALNTGRIAPFTGGSRAVQDGVFSPEQLHQAVKVLATVVIGGGVLLSALAGPGLLAVGLAGLTLGWAYSQPRVALMSRGWGEPAVAMGWWLVVVGADYVQRHAFSAIAAIAGVSPALLIAAVLWIAQFPDAEADRSAGKHTLVVRLGEVRAALVYALIVLAAHAWLALWWWADWLPTAAWWAAGSLPLSLAAATLLRRHARAPERLRAAIVLTLLAALMHGGLLTAAFVRVATLR
ncbi:MAG: prenyltransferase [Burkholderiales bacterium]